MKKSSNVLAACQPYILEVKNLSRDARIVVLFDCNELFEAVNNRDIRIASLIPGVTYKEILISKFSGLHAIDKIMIASTAGKVSWYWEQLSPTKENLLDTWYLHGAPVISFTDKEPTGNKWSVPILFPNKHIEVPELPKIQNQISIDVQFTFNPLSYLTIMSIPAYATWLLYFYPLSMRPVKSAVPNALKNKLKKLL